jgi:putative phosphoribosyl transferase
MAAFRDRDDAAARLGNALAEYRHQRPLVLAVPRGGVPMGRALADALEGDLDVVLVHKIGSPHQPELAIGAVDEHGHVVLDALAGELGIPAAAAQAIADREADGLRARRAALEVPPADPAGRVVIIVDDGIATGATVMAAIRFVRRGQPQRVVVATPVAPPDTLHRLEHEADHVVSLLVPPDFQAVGQYYDDFSPVSDEEVAAALTPRRT